MKRGKKWPLNGLLHLNRDLVAAAATAAASAAEGIPDHHLRFEQRHRSYSMDGRTDGGVAAAAATRMDTKKERGRRANPPFLCMVTR